MTAPEPVLSVVIPLYNESAMVDALMHRLEAVLRPWGESFEVIAVDDGSRDDTWSKLGEARVRVPELRLVRLSRNFGQQAAISAGLDLARGGAVAVVDADLQDPPELLPEFIRCWREGSEVVYGVRATRREHWLLRAAYAVFYRLLSRLAPIEIPRDAGDFCLMDRRVVDLLRRMPERNRFLRGLRTWVGFRQAAVPYDRPARHAGRPAYTLGKLLALAADGIAAFSYLPLRLSAVAGVLVAAAGIAFALFAVAARFVWPVPIPAGWASVVVLVCVIGGTQLVVLGIMGEYLARIYDEAKQRPSYIIRDLDPPA